MKVLNVHEAKTHLSQVLAQIESTQVGVAICSNGVPVADIIPHQQRSLLTPDPFLSQVKILRI